MRKRLFTGVFLLVSLAFMAGESYACPILKAIIYPAEPVPKITWVHVGHATSFDGSYSVGSIVNCTWSLPGAYDIQYSTVTYPNDHVSCKFGAVGQYTVTLTVRDSQGRTDTDTCTVYVVSIGIGIAPGESSYVAVNNDDDNENGIMDMCEDGTVSNEDTQPYDLRKILLYVQTPKLSDKVVLGVGPEWSCGIMKIWSHRDKQNQIVPPPGSSEYSAKLPAWSSSEPHEFYVEALSSWTPGEPFVRFCYMAVDERTTPPTEWVFPPREPEAQINFTLLEVDVDIDGVKDDYYREGSVTEETIPGGFIALNDDDDNNNGTPDKDESGPVAGENDLVKITLWPVSPTQLPIDSAHPVTLKAISGGEKIRIWDNETKTGDPVGLPKHYYSRTDFSDDLWVEGIGLSSTPRDITLALEYAGFEDRIKATVVKVNLTSTDLYGTVPESNEETPGAFIHFNLDNDDSSDNSVEGPKRPGADYANNTNVVANEDDLKNMSMSLQPLLTEGSIVLTIPAGAKIWKHWTKGSSNLVLDSGSKVWNLANTVERSDFLALCSSLYVEGTASNSSGDIVLQYINPPQTKVVSDKVYYHFIAADCGDQPRTEAEDIYYWDTSVIPPVWKEEQGYKQRDDSLEGEGHFEGLERCEYSITHNLAPRSWSSGKRCTIPEYNCIAWSVDEPNFWYNPDYIAHNYVIIQVN